MLVSLLGIVISFIIFGTPLILFSILSRDRILFRQERPGKNGSIFTVLKFKTMTDARDENGNFKPDAERITKTGMFIRKLSLDELPQLVNVIKGDMSLIGPRPLLPEYLLLYNDLQQRRHEVKPGITGWAQVNGRNALGWEEKFEFDVWYVDNVSFLLDLKIIWMTFVKVIMREGVSSGTSVTMEKFRGSL